MTLLVEGLHTDETGAGAEWLPVCWDDALETGIGHAASVGGRPVALFRFADGSVHATAHACPATGEPVMAEGIMGTRSTGDGLVATLASPSGREVYRLDTGACLGPRDLALEIYPVRVQGGRVMVRMAR